MSRLNRFFDIPSLDPDDARRRKILNILLVGFWCFCLIALISGIVVSLSGVGTETENSLLIIGAAGMLLGIAVIFVINRFWSGWIAASLFIFLVIGGLAFADSPEQVAIGRTLFIFTIPVIMASVLLPPYTSFVAAGMVSVVISVAATNIGIAPNMPAIAGFFGIALISWLSARSLDRALEDLRVINRELDHRVVERTAELAKALDRIQAEANKSQAILTSIADGVIVFDPDGCAFVSNPSVARLIGFPEERINGSSMTQLMVGKVKDSDQSKLLELLTQKNGNTGLGILKIQWSDRVLSVNSAPVRDSSSVLWGTVVVFRDFTKEAELERLKSAFVSMASHELRTPLNAILGFSDMLRVGAMGPMPVEQTNILDRVIANVHRMLGLVNNLLDQAQIESGGLRPNITKMNIQNLVKDVHDTMKVLAEQKGIAFTHSIAETVPAELSSDPQRIQQILINLLGNAIKFTDEGSVDIRVYLPDDQHWALQVADSGPGIPPDAQEYIFEPFRQVGDPVTRRHGGSGLGLAIVKQLAQLLGGDISLESAVGRGSTFTATFPISSVQEQTA
jgi:PAS domain S-box-containing protein